MKLSWKMVGAVATVGLVGVACGSTDESAFDEKGEETIYPPGYDAGFDPKAARRRGTPATSTRTIRCRSGAGPTVAAARRR